MWCRSFAPLVEGWAVKPPSLRGPPWLASLSRQNLLAQACNTLRPSLSMRALILAFPTAKRVPALLNARSPRSRPACSPHACRGQGPPAHPVAHSSSSDVPPRPGGSGGKVPPPQPPGNREDRGAGGSGGGGGGDSGGRQKEPPPEVMGGFLGSLMGSMEETHKSVAGTAAGKGGGHASEQTQNSGVSLRAPKKATYFKKIVFVTMLFLWPLPFHALSRGAKQKTARFDSGPSEPGPGAGDQAARLKLRGGSEGQDRGVLDRPGGHLPHLSPRREEPQINTVREYFCYALRCLPFLSSTPRLRWDQRVE